MKKIFAISMLAFFAIGAARAEWSPVYTRGGNYNIATVELLNENLGALYDDLLDTVDSALEAKVDVAQDVANAIMITNAAGNVIPAPVGDCANTTNKCALVTGVDESGNQVLQWEVIARNVVQPTE